MSDRYPVDSATTKMEISRKVNKMGLVIYTLLSNIVKPVS